MASKKPRLKKDGTPWGQTGRKPQKAEQKQKVKGGKIQEIIDSRQAPGIHIPDCHKATWKPGMPDPDTPLDWSERTQKGGHL